MGSGVVHIEHASNLVEIARARASHQPERIAYTFLPHGQGGEESISYAALDLRARAIAARLQALGAAGERALLLYPPGLDYIAAFLGCLYAGVVAVPASPPRGARTLPRLMAVASDATPRLVLTTTAQARDATHRLGEMPAGIEHVVSTDDLPDAEADAWRMPRIDGDTLAFLQYTSGSTAAPRGVMVSHGNLLHNERMIRAAFGHSERSVVVGWLPLYHDMGLIGNVLQPLYAGARCVLMSPLSFLERPVRWLMAISHYRATTSGGPNFAYDLCVRRVQPEVCEGLDLSCWAVAFNGSEPVRPETMERFASAFAPYGFSRRAFFPAYGLAEATLFVSGGPRGEGPAVLTLNRAALEQGEVVPSGPDAEAAHTRLLAASGMPHAEQTLLIVDPATGGPCPPGRIGEVWLAGPGVACGYWGRPDLTRELFHAEVGDMDSRGFLRTGDLGVLHDGHLFITGRIKDLIIIRGRNLYPEDVEATAAAAHPTLQPAAAAFAIDVAGEDRLVVVQEADRHAGAVVLEGAITAIRDNVVATHEAEVFAVVLVHPGGVARTSSGKVQRFTCREAYLANTLPVLARSVRDLEETGVRPAPYDASAEQRRTRLLGLAPDQRRAAVLSWLRAAVVTIGGVPSTAVDVDVSHRNLHSLGLDSLMAVEVQHRIERDLGVVLPLSDILGDITLVDLAVRLDGCLDGVSPVPAPLLSPPDMPDHTARPDGGSIVPPSDLTAGQRALWYMHQLAPESAAFTIAGAAKVCGVLDARALLRACEALGDRHPILRMTVRSPDGGPERGPDCVGPLCVRVAAAGWTDATMRERLREYVNQPFDLEHGPLARLYLFERGVDGDILLLKLHHLVADFRSVEVLLRDLETLYADAVAGIAPSLSPPAADFGDVARYQAAVLASDQGERLRRYWQAQLDGELPVVDLPTDRPRGPRRFRGRTHRFTIGRAATRRLSQLVRAEGVTPYTVLLAAWQAFLHRYTGQTEVLVGSPVAGRDRAAFAETVGYLTNVAVLRADLSGAPSFRAVARAAMRTVVDALDHGAYPFRLLVEEIAPRRDPTRPPLAQTMFVLHRALDDGAGNLARFALGQAGARLRFADVTLESIDLEVRGSQVELELAMAESDGDLIGTLRYDVDLFDPATVARMATEFRVLLRAAVAAPDTPIVALPLMNGGDRRRIAGLCAGPTRAYPLDRPLHRLVEEQAARTPDATALQWEDGRLTYREMDRRAGRLARWLRALGVGPQTVIGVFAERSPELVVAVLAVLKAGGAYLPLDPSYPAARLAFMLEDARPQVVLTTGDMDAALPAHAGDTLRIDEELGAYRADAGDAEPSVAGFAYPSEAVTPDDLAYVIYTSGSTGQPKGVMIPHRGVCNRLHWMQEAYELTPDDRVLFKTPFSFDVSVWEIFWPLITGATMVIARADGHRDPAYLLELMVEQQVTTAHFVPSLLRRLLDRPEVERCMSLRRVICSGEALTPALQDLLLARLDVQLHNLYGPTEASIDATAWACRSGDDPVPIGRPIANMQAYVLDGLGQLQPPGVTGELYLGGVGLARGYLNRPALTAERFVPDRFSGVPGARLYRTGDLARMRPDGVIEFLGRTDDQVKVRGVRVELGEIEAALAAHPAVQAAAVAPRGEGLRAFVVRAPAPARSAAPGTRAASGTTYPGAADLQTYLRGRLPDALVPDAIVFLDALPLGPAGKLDRRALAALDVAPAAGVDFEPAATPLEHEVAALWAEVLGVEHPGRRDTFFQLGGHSLLLAELQLRIEARFGRRVALRHLFESPTIAGHAEMIAHSPDSGAAPMVTALVRAEPPARRFPVAYRQEPLYWLGEVMGQAGFFQVPVATEWEDQVPVDVLQSALRLLAGRHATLRTVLAHAGGEPVQVVRDEPEVEFHFTDLTHLSPDRARTAAMEALRLNRAVPFRLDTGPPLRVHLFHLPEGQQILALNVHHLFADGWSLGTLTRDLVDLCEALRTGSSTDLPAPAVEYADYARWMRERIAQGELTHAERYWQEQLNPPPADAALPTDREPDARHEANEGRAVRAPVPPEVTLRLRARAAEWGATLHTTLFSAWAVLLHRLTGADDLVIGMPVAGRDHPALRDVVGCFVDVVPLRVGFEDDDTVEAVVARIQGRVLGALEHAGYPVALLMRRVARTDPRRGLFATVFGMRNFPIPRLVYAGREVAVTDLEPDIPSKAPLIWTVSEHAEGLTCEVRYDPGVFDEETVAAFLARYLAVLCGMCDGADRSIYALPLETGPGRPGGSGMDDKDSGAERAGGGAVS